VKDIGRTMADNAFGRIDDWALAQALAHTLSPDAMAWLLPSASRRDKE
jgi:hypothetical protein